MSSYANLRYVAIYRTSSNHQSEKSIPDQRLIVERFAKEHNMIPAGGDKIQGGISSTRRRKREDIEELITRKQEFDDFDAIVVHDFSRLTRKGVKDAFAIEKQLNANNIKVISALEQFPEGPYSDVIKSLLHTQHLSYVRDGSHRVARGQMSSIMAGKSLGAFKAPFGIDRLYTGLDGVPRYITRTLADGSRVRLDAKTKEVLSTYDKRNGNDDTSGQCYHKQSDEIVTLVPGDPKMLDIVRRIFRMVVVEGVGYWGVASQLIQDGALAPYGKTWHKLTVKRIINSPVFTGRLIFNRYSTAEFFQRGKDGPVQVPDGAVNPDLPVKQRMRSPEEWIVKENPATKDILDPELRELAIAFQDNMHRKSAIAAQHSTSHAPKRDKHVHSSFILKDVLRLKQDGSSMRGSVTRPNRNGKVYRYYKPCNYNTPGSAGTALGKMISAEPAEALVLSIVSQVLSSTEELRPTILRFIKQVQADRLEQRTSLGELEKQRETLIKKITCFADIGEFDDGVIEKVQKMRSRLKELDNKIRMAKEVTVYGDADVIADSIIQGLAQMRTAIGTASPMTLRRMLMLLVGRMEVDPMTREIWLDVSLPTWAVLKEGQVGLNKVCLEEPCFKTSTPEAKQCLLLAKVHMRCVRENSNAKRTHDLHLYNYDITDGILPPKVNQNVVAPLLEGHEAAVLEDVQAKIAVHGDLPGLTWGRASFPLAADAITERVGPFPQSWGYWTPEAIAA